MKETHIHGKRPMKETCIDEKRPIRETCFYQKRPVSMKRDLYNRPVLIKRDLQKRPISASSCAAKWRSGEGGVGGGHWRVKYVTNVCQKRPTYMKRDV